jgi:orotate phosphoribosyltransferase
MSNYEEKALEIFYNTGALISDDHFVYTSGKHGSDYVAKDTVYPFVLKVYELAEIISLQFVGKVNSVIGPEKGGIILAQWVAFHLSLKSGSEVYAVYAEKDQAGKFSLTRGYDQFIVGKDVLVVEDVITTGGSVKSIVDLVRKHQGKVVAVAALWNRGQKTNNDINCPEIYSVINKRLPDFSPFDCPLCKQGVPINRTVGKGSKIGSIV